MSQFAPPPSPMPSPADPGPMYAPRPMPQIVHVAARPGVFAWLLGTFLGIVAVGIVFGFGWIIGLAMGLFGAEFDSPLIERTYREGGSDTVAIIPVYGVINDMQSQFVHLAVDRALADSSVKAVVLRVDSPGGGVAASDQIWSEVQRLKDKGLPVVASYGSVAASGGYYVSCGADHIMAEETTITGSIGVIAQVVTLEGLLEKVGIEPVTLVATGSPEKDAANDIMRSWTDRDRQKVQTMLDSAYDVFHARVKAGRSAVITDPQKISQLANGSIYTSQQALDSGLIDSIGYLDDAIAQAEKMAGIIVTGGATVIRIELIPPLFEQGPFLRESPRLGGPDDWSADRIRSLVNDLSSPRVMYLMR